MTNFDDVYKSVSLTDHDEKLNEFRSKIFKTIKNYITFEDVSDFEKTGINNSDVILRSDLSSAALLEALAFIAASTVETYVEDSQQKEKLIQELVDKVSHDLKTLVRANIEDIKAMQRPIQ